MDAVWSYWSAPAGPTQAARWKSSFHHLISWALSVSMPGVASSRKVLYTDSPGAELLVEAMGLPFDQVHCTLDDLPAQMGRFWVLGKLHAYRAHQRPFVHLDSDVYLWKQLPTRLTQASIFAQNPERFSRESYDYRPTALLAYLDRTGTTVPAELRWYTALGGNEAYCCGILGGRRTDLLSTYAHAAIELILSNQSTLSHLPDDIEVNVLMEQYFLSAFCAYHLMMGADSDLSVEHLFESELESRRARRSEVLGYTHLIGPAKLDSAILDRLARYTEANLPEYHARAKRHATRNDLGP
jgi:hypothetical protein